MKRPIKDRTEDGLKKSFTWLDAEVSSFVRRRRIRIPALPLNFVKLAAAEKAYSIRPATIAFPSRFMLSQFAIYFVSVLVSFTLAKSFLIVPASILLIFAVVHNSFTRKIAMALLLSSAKTALFTAALFIIAAATGIYLRILLFGRGW